MDQDKLYMMVGQLYTRTCLLDEENKRLRLALQSKDEELGLLRDKLSGPDQSRISNK